MICFAKERPWLFLKSLNNRTEGLPCIDLTPRATTVLGQVWYICSVIQGLGQYDISHPPAQARQVADNICPYLLLDVRDRDDYMQCHIVTGECCWVSPTNKHL